MSMAWYGTAFNASTCAVANAGTTVTITGANLVDDGGSNPGFVSQGWIGPDGKTYEIVAILNATQFTIRFPGAATGYQGTTVASGGSYAIIPVQGFARDAAYKLSQLANLPLAFSSVLANAKAAVLAGVVLANGWGMIVGGNTAINDGYGGVFVYNSTDTTTTFSQDGMGFVDNQGRRFFRQAAPGLFDVRWFKAQLNGSDDAVPLTAALAAVGVSGGRLLIPGILSVASTSLGSASFAVANKVTVYGYNKLSCGITITGSNEALTIFVASNPNDVWFENLTLTGNSICTAAGTAGGIFFWGTSGAGAEMKNFGTKDILVSNFRHDYKIYVRNDSNYVMRNTRHENPEVKSFTGNDRNSAAIGVPSTFIAFRGEVFHVGAFIENITIINPTGDGTWHKSGINFWTGVKKATVLGGNLLNYGTGNNVKNVGAYGINAYNDDAGGLGPTVTPPSDILIDGTRMVNVLSCGVYSADGKNITVINCAISGCTDDLDSRAGAYLPKAAIALAGVSGHNLVDKNKLDENYVGVYIATHANSNTTLGTNPTKSAITSATGIIISPSNDTNANSTTQVNNSMVQLTGTTCDAMYISSNTSAVQPGVIIINGGVLSGTRYGLRAYDQATTAGVVCTSLALGGGLLITSPTGSNTLSGIGFTCTTTATPLIIDGVTVECAGFTSASYGMDVSGCTKLTMKALILKNKISSAAAINLVGCKGTMALGAITFINCPVPYVVASADFGITAPSGYGELNDVVENLNPVEAGSAASKYIIIGWKFTTVWLQMRALTGN